MKAPLAGLVAAFTFSLLVSGCASAGSALALAPVGPEAQGRPWPGPDGYLEVFSATRTVDVDFRAYFNPHTDYEIRDTSGKRVRFVPNHASNMDESPDQVTLPPGNYNVVAQSAWCGLVTVPVTIQQGKTTVVHLDGNYWHPPAASANQLVYLPNGEAVGWSVSSPASAK